MAIGDLLDRDEDRAAYVRFERVAVKDNEASLREGCYKSKDQDMIYVTPPYSKDEYPSKVDVFFQKKEGDVRRGKIPQKHLDLWKEAYDRWQKGQEPPLDGTDVRNWPAISPAQAKNLIAAGCRTIEDLAQANDEAIRRIGMGAYDLKAKAKAYIQAAKDHGPLTEEVAQLKNENRQLHGTIESLQEQIKRLEIHLDAKENKEPPRNTTGFQPAAEEVIKQSEEVAQKQVLEMLRRDYEAKFGEKPHGRMKIETLREKLKS